MTIEDFENAASIVPWPLNAASQDRLYMGRHAGKADDLRCHCQKTFDQTHLRPFNIAETWMANASRQQGQTA